VVEVVLRAVLFDWDGTLLDSAEACRRSYERLFGNFGIAFDDAIFEATYSPDWYRTYERVGLPRDKWGDADAAWLQFNAEEECSLVTGAHEALTLLERKGISTGLVTSGTGQRVRRELARLGLAFPAVICSEDVTRRKPHPEALLAGLAQLDVHRRTPPTSATARKTWKWRVPPVSFPSASRAPSRTGEPSGRRPRTCRRTTYWTRSGLF
jgi:HAD superfamily hydrolase (TIGR01549 family)